MAAWRLLAALCVLSVNRVHGNAVQSVPQQAPPAPHPPLYITGAFPPTSGALLLGRPAALFYRNGPQIPGPPQNFPLRIIGYITAAAPQQPPHPPPPPPVYEDEEPPPPRQHPLDGVLVIAAPVNPSPPPPPQHTRLIQITHPQGNPPLSRSPESPPVLVITRSPGAGENHVFTSFSSPYVSYAY